MFTISKDFSLDYGHRVYNQELNEKYALTNFCKCKRLHGHTGKITVGLSAEDLVHEGFVTDFNHLSWFKEFVDQNLDHKFFLGKNDPLFLSITGTQYSPEETVNISGAEVFADVEDDEFLSSFVIVPFSPTSENLAKWIYEIIEEKMKSFDNLKVDYVVWSETEKTKAVYGL